MAALLPELGDIGVHEVEVEYRRVLSPVVTMPPDVQNPDAYFWLANYEIKLVDETGFEWLTFVVDGGFTCFTLNFGLVDGQYEALWAPSAWVTVTDWATESRPADADTLVGLGPLLVPLGSGLRDVLDDLPQPEFQHVDQLQATPIGSMNWADKFIVYYEI